MSVRAQVEAIIYATEEPVTLNQFASLLRDAVLAELHAEESARLALNEMLTDDTNSPPGQAGDETPEIETLNDVTSHPQLAERCTEDSNGQPVSAEDTTRDQQREREKEESKQVKAYLARILDELTAEYAGSSHGVEVRQIAGGYRMGTKPEHHDVVVGFAKSLKPPVRLSLQALETLAVIAYKQPVTVPEISDIRGVDSSGVIATLLDRKLITTSGRKQVIGRPILYKTTKEFLLRFGLNDVGELPSMEEFEKLGDPQAQLFAPTTVGPAADVTNASAMKQGTPAEPETLADDAPAEAVASGVDEAEATGAPDAEA